MNANEIITARGDVHLVLRGPDGQIKEEHDRKNLVVTAGLGFIASRMVGVAQNVMSHMALGSGTTAAALANAGLVTELGRASLGSSGASGAVVTYSATFNPGVATGAVTEAGIFNASSAGTMLCRTVFPVVNKQAGDTMSVTWTITLS